MSRSVKSLALRALLLGIHAAGKAARAIVKFLAWTMGWCLPMAKKILVRLFVLVDAATKMIRSVIHGTSTLSSLWNPKRMMLQATVVLVVLVGTRTTLFASDQVVPTAQPNIVAKLLNPPPSTTLIEDSTLPILQPAGSGNAEDLSAVDSQLLDLFVYDEETISGEEQSPADEEYMGLESPLSLPGSDIIPAPSGPARTGVIEYVVTDGDTVSSISERFGVSINTVLWENSLGAYSVIRPAQILRILPTSGIKYVIKKGDTLQRIANTTNSSIEDIRAFNGITNDQLVAGSTIIVPRGRIVAAPRVTKPAGANNSIISLPSNIDASNIVGLVWPTISRKINQYFRGSRHTGVDIKGSKGASIYAADDGTVVLAGWNRGGYGQQVILKHEGGLVTRYAHMSKILVKSGKSVAKGEVIGLVGSTGRSTGPHLHFEVLKGSQRLNPLLLYK